MVEVYKVVRPEGSKLLSALAHGGYTVTYEVGKDAIPEIGYLYAFKNKKAAKNFMAPFDLIFRADADVVDAPVLVMTQSDFGEEAMAEFWKSPNLWNRIGGEAPVGSVWCSRIRLLEEVEW